MSGVAGPGFWCPWPRSVWMQVQGPCLAGSGWEPLSLHECVWPLCVDFISPSCLWGPGRKRSSGLHALPPGSELGPSLPPSPFWPPSCRTGCLPAPPLCVHGGGPACPAAGCAGAGTEARTEPMPACLPPRPVLPWEGLLLALASSLGLCILPEGHQAPKGGLRTSWSCRRPELCLWAVLVMVGHVPGVQQAPTPMAGLQLEGWGLTSPPTCCATDLAPFLLQAGASLPLRLLWLPQARALPLGPSIPGPSPLPPRGPTIVLVPLGVASGPSCPKARVSDSTLTRSPRWARNADEDGQSKRGPLHC